MTARRGRRAAWVGAGAFLLFLGASALLLRDFIAEQIATRDLRSKDSAIVSAALEKLAAARSHRAVPALVELYREREKQRPVTKADDDDPTDAMEVVRVAARVGPRALAAVIRASSEHEIHFMVFLLEHLDDLLPTLTVCLEDHDPKVRRLAALGLRHRADKVVQPLEARLQDESTAVRCAAAWSLAKTRTRDIAVRQALASCLENADPGIREESLRALGTMDERGELAVLASRLTPQLVSALGDQHPGVRRLALQALSHSHQETAIPALEGLLEDGDPAVRSSALHALLKVLESAGDSPRARAAAVRAFDVLRASRDFRVESLAVRALSRHVAVARDRFAALLAWAGSEGWLGLPQLLAVWGSSLGARGQAAVPILLKRFARPLVATDGDVALFLLLSRFEERASIAFPEVLELARAGQADAVTALSRIAPRKPETYELLESLLRDGEAAAQVRAAAASGLGRMRHRAADAVALLEPIVKATGEHHQVWSGAVAGLGELGPLARAAVPSLEALLEGPPWRSTPVAMALWRIEPRLMARCAFYLQRDLPVAPGAFSGLLELGPQAGAAAPALTALWEANGRQAAESILHDIDDWTIGSALQGIGEPAVPSLLDALRSGDPFVRGRAAAVLGLIGPSAESAIPALEAALADIDEEVRREAAKALPRVSVLRELHRPPEMPHPSPPRFAPLVQAADGAAITTREAWEAHRRELRERWAAFLGELPAPRVPLAMEILATEELTRVTRHHVRYAVEDGELVDGYLLVPWDLPADGSRRAPGVVVFHQTVETHAQQPAGVDPSRPDLHIALHLAERGFVTLAPRCFIFAEGADYREHVRRVLDRHPTWKGMTRMLLDGVRAADCLASLPYVDPARLGCIGHSLGAKETLYAAAFDERYRAAVFSEGGIGLGMTNWEDVWYLGPEAKRPDFEREHHELLALVAPRAFLLLAGGEGGADDAQAWSYVEAALPVFRLHAAEARFGWRSHGYGHDYPREARGLAEEFLRRALED